MKSLFANDCKSNKVEQPELSKHRGTRVIKIINGEQCPGMVENSFPRTITCVALDLSDVNDHHKG